MSAAADTRARLLRPRRLEPGEEAELTDHLDELRKRLLLAIAAVVVGTGLGYAVHGRIIEALTNILPRGHHQLITLSIAEPFMTSLKVSIYAGIAMALPVILWQGWGFFAPSFQRPTQRTLLAYSGIGLVLAGVGVAFGYLFALPSAVHFLTNYDSNLYNVQVRASSYYSFALAVLLACAMVFELPVFVVGLVRFRVLTTRKLRSHRKHGYILVAVLAVLLPGVDPVTTAMEMVPLWVLFEGSIWVSVFVERGMNARRDAATAADEAAGALPLGA